MTQTTARTGSNSQGCGAIAEQAEEGVQGAEAGVEDPLPGHRRRHERDDVRDEDRGLVEAGEARPRPVVDQRRDDRGRAES